MLVSRLALETWLFLVVFLGFFGFSLASICGKACTCPDGIIVNCTNAGLKSIPYNEDPKIRKLLLSKNDVTLINSADLEYSQLEVLDLSYQAEEVNLEREPFKKLVKLEWLSFHATDVLRLDSKHFSGLGNLQTLDFSRTNVRHFLRPKIFESLVSLNRLDLSHNELTELDAGVFYGLNQLSSLDLSHNHLKTIPLLVNVPNLQHLKLRGNRITAIVDNSFEGLSNLISLKFDDNPLSRIEETAFQPFSKLVTLSFRKSELTAVPSRIFNYLPNLTHFDLSGSEIHTLTHHAFQNIDRLETLKIGDSRKLKTIESYAFQKLPSLATLDLSGNVELSKIDGHWIDDVPNLHTLSVANCDLKHLPKGHLSPTLRTIDAASNPFSCTCENAWLADFCRYQEAKYGSSCGAICSSPEKYDKSPITDLHEEGCTVPARSEVKSGDLKTLHLVLIIVLPLIFLIFAGVCCFVMRKRIRTCCGKGRASCLCKRSSFQSKQPLVTVANWRKRDRNSTNLTEIPDTGDPPAFKVLAQYPVPITEL